VLRLRQTLELKDASGATVAVVRKKLMAVHETMEIERGGAIATVQKAMFSPLHHKSVIDLPDGGRLEATGNIWDKEFEIRSPDGQVAARVSRSWFSMRDTYGVDVAPGEDDVLMVCVAIALDRIHHDEEERRGR
jgi:uncharacterized protein YxjI